MNRISISFLLALPSIIIPHAFAHFDHEGFCATVLPSYPRDDGIDIASFVLCECEENHVKTSGNSLVVCRYNHTNGGLTTGSCDAKMCLFTQECTVPVNFRPSDLDDKGFEYSFFDPWCVDKAKYETVDEYYSTISPTASPTKEMQSGVPTGNPITPSPQHAHDMRQSAFIQDIHNLSISSRLHYTMPLQILMGVAIIISMF